MKLRQRVRQVIYVACLCAATAAPARANLITFDDVPPAITVGSLASGGFTFTSSGHYHTELNGATTHAQDGTQMLWNHTFTNVMTTVDGSLFNLLSFSGGEYYTPSAPAYPLGENATTIRVIGTTTFGTVMQDFFLNGIIDGPGGVADMQLFTLSAAFVNLTQVEFVGLGGTTPNYYSLDDIEANPVPEPASLLLLGAGLAGLVAHRARRRAR